jgi:hypothetical protein
MSIAPEIEVVSTPADFMPREVVKGHMVTETGLALAVVIATPTALEAFLSMMRKR